MPKEKKDKKEPEPIDKIKERQELVETASAQFQNKMLDLAGEFGLSAAEVFAVVSGAMYRLADTAVQAEHEEYFGPESEQEDE